MSEIHINSRQITTCTAGLFSSVLSAARTSVTADEEAIKQARLLTDALRTTVGDANTTRRLATQFANLALLLVEEGDFDQEFRRMVYMNFYQATQSTRGQFGEASGSSSSAAMKTWMWVLYMATDYENKSVAKSKHPIIGYNAGVRPRLSNQGKIDNPNELIAFPHDTAIGSLVQLTDDNRPLGNLMLFGRRIWYEGYLSRWNEVPALMSAERRSHLLEDMAQVLDSNFRTTCTHQFIRRYIDMLRGKLVIKAGVPLDWPQASDLLRLLNENDKNKHADANTINTAFPTIEDSVAKKIARVLQTQSDTGIFTECISKAAYSNKTQPKYWPQSAFLAHYIFAMIFRIDSFGHLWQSRRSFKSQNWSWRFGSRNFWVLGRIHRYWTKNSRNCIRLQNCEIANNR